MDECPRCQSTEYTRITDGAFTFHVCDRCGEYTEADPT